MTSNAKWQFEKQIAIMFNEFMVCFAKCVGITFQRNTMHEQ